jgi:hypothetical protein
MYSMKYLLLVVSSFPDPQVFVANLEAVSRMLYWFRILPLDHRKRGRKANGNVDKIWYRTYGTGR